MKIITEKCERKRDDDRNLHEIGKFCKFLSFVSFPVSRAQCMPSHRSVGFSPTYQRFSLFYKLVIFLYTGTHKNFSNKGNELKF